MRAIRDDTGFTVVEMLVTVVLASIFLAFFIQMFRATTAQQLSLVRQSAANNIAKSNISKFPTAESVSDLVTCDTTSSPASSNTNNTVIYANAPGTLILNNSSSYKEDDPGNLGELTQRVLAYFPSGCIGGTAPIKLQSSVEYGFTGQRNKVEVTTYVF